MKKVNLFYILPVFAIFVLMYSSCNAFVVENTTHDFISSPGNSIQSVFWVQNPSSTIKKMSIYQTDYTQKPDGSIEFGKTGQSERSNAEWITFSPNQFSIAPSGKIEVKITIQIPNKSLSGTYWSMIMVEEEPPPTVFTSDGTGDIVTGVKAFVRQAIQVRTSITGTGEMKAKLFNQKVYKGNEKSMFEVMIENTGTLFFRGDFWVELFNSEGYPIGKTKVVRQGVYPGMKEKLTTDISFAKSGKYTALCVYDTQSTKVFGAKYQIIIP